MSNNNSGTAGSPVEYVTTYTQHGSPNTVRSASSWGIVAPGGDPASDNDSDDLHWIENIWTTTPFIGFTGDTNFTGECTDDYPNGASASSPVDCRTLIAGTSMATPHVAGAAALILSATGLGFWIASLPASLNAYSYGAAVLWTWVELLAIAVGLSLGAAEIGMSCRLRGGPKSVVAVATGFHGVTLAAGLVVAAVSVMIAGSVLELLALNGTFLPRALSCRAARTT